MTQGRKEVAWLPSLSDSRWAERENAGWIPYDDEDFAQAIADGRNRTAS